MKNLSSVISVSRSDQNCDTKRKISGSPTSKESVRRKWSTFRIWENLISGGVVIAGLITSKIRYLPFPHTDSFVIVQAPS